MTITAAQLYWITRLDALITLSVILASTAVVIFIALTMTWIFDDFATHIKLRHIIFSGLFSIILIVISLAIPTTKQAIAMLYLPPVVNSNAVQELPGNLLIWLNEQLNIQVNGGEK